MPALPSGGSAIRTKPGENQEETSSGFFKLSQRAFGGGHDGGFGFRAWKRSDVSGSEAPLRSLWSLWVTGVRKEERGKRSHFPWLSLEHTSLSLPPCSEFGLLPELFPRVVSSLACRQVWMFCQHSREFMIACRCASKNTLYPKQKLMQA